MPHPANRRMPLSCEPCRERKIRCPRDASDPKGTCESCVRRGVHPADCVFLRDVQPRRYLAKQREQLDKDPQQTSSNADLLARIQSLEQRLARHADDASSVASGQRAGAAAAETAQYSPQSGPPSSFASGSTAVELNVPHVITRGSPDSAVSCLGTLVRSKSGHEHYEPYSSRWSSVLNSNPATSDLHSELEAVGAEPDFPLKTNEVAISELLSILPPVSQCNALVKAYFSVFAPLWHILHNPTFYKDYTNFQANPLQASLPWLALLFSLLAVAVTSLNEDDALLHELGRLPKPSDNMQPVAKRYRTAAMKCLEADHYLWRHNMYTLQALITLIYGINHSHGQSWALLGTARNIALALGCHIDPDNFDLSLVKAEERRRCWAALNMLYTIQNATLGNIDSTHLQTNVKWPLDVEDEGLEDDGGDSAVTDCGPSQTSYLLYKFRLYDICSRICSRLFTPGSTPSYDTIMSLDAEITSQQDEWNLKYLVDTQTSPIPAYHAVHLNILFGYSHQLFLLLHRPVLLQQNEASGSYYTPEQVLMSRSKCLESARALLGLHSLLHENEAFRPYQWYNRGLGSFHAFHAAVFIGYLCKTSTDLSLEARVGLKRDLSSALVTFEAIKDTGMSRICEKVAPILKKLLNTLRDIQQRADAANNSTSNLAFVRETPLPSLECIGSAPPFGHQQVRGLVESLQPQQWLSPSVMMPWNDWESMFTTFVERSG